jgi:carboxyl-terminal processing protease
MGLADEHTWAGGHPSQQGTSENAFPSEDALSRGVPAGRGGFSRAWSGLIHAVLACALALTGCATAPQTRLSLQSVPAAQQAQAQRNLTLFNKVWDLVNRKHYDPKYQGVNWEEAAAKFGPLAIAAADDAALYATLNSMLSLLRDSHTHALTPVQAEERRTRQRARTGFNMVRVSDRWIVSEVLPGSPAEEAGVKVGWIVLSRNGEPLGERLDFRPKVGDEWQWEFLDEKERRVVLTPKAKVLSTAPRQIARELEGGFVYLRFDGFDGTDRRWLSRELKKNAAAPGAVIDLRRNPGGDTFSLGTAIGEFFDEAVDCGTFISRNGARSVKNSWQIGSANYRGKVVILVDTATGSAAEIFSAVLQDHGRAKIIGRTTAGAVLASWFYRLPDGGELQLSRQDYVSPKGRRIEATGVRPDIEVPRTLEDLRTGRDRDLEEALKILRAK